MTEAEWLAATDPAPMLDVVGVGPFRKLTRFAVAGATDLWDSLGEQSRLKVRAAEQNEDGFWSGADVGMLTLELIETHPAERARFAAMLRCIFGNPFRPVALDPAWRTSVVLALASGIYDDRAFDRLPILADALQDAGCDHPDILAHCRSDGPHARGCWVVDLILGKS